MRLFVSVRSASAALILIGPCTFTPASQAKTVTYAPSPAEHWSYADIADLFAAAAIVAQVRVVQASRIAPSPATASQRYYVEANTVSLIRAPSAQPPRLRYLADIVPDSRGKAPRLTKQMMLIAAKPARPGEVQLLAPDAQVPWSPALDARIRALLADVTAADAPPVVTGITSAFHVAGALAGESETQVFLSTRDERPVSLSILRRPGQPPTWSVAFGEIVDEAATIPAHDTLGWYRLACTLPAELPATATAELSAADADTARADYGVVIQSLGRCTRTRGQK